MKETSAEKTVAVSLPKIGVAVLLVSAVAVVAALFGSQLLTRLDLPLNLFQSKDYKDFRLSPDRDASSDQDTSAESGTFSDPDRLLR